MQQTVFYPVYKSYEYRIEFDIMDDNIKMYHYAYKTDSKQWEYLDHSPYDTMTEQQFREAVDILVMAEERDLYNNQESEWDV